VVLVSLILGLVVALLLDRKFIGRGAVRTMMITPFLVVPVAAALLWKHALYNPEYGLLKGTITAVWRLFGSNRPPQPDWISTMPLLSVETALIWQWTPFMMLILLAGLQGRPLDVVEAARIDGAGSWQIFRYMTFPHLRQYLELGALLSIRLQDPEGFTRYFQQLQPFYALPNAVLPKDGGVSQASKITGLYLLLLLSDGDYAGFHTCLEGLEVAAGMEVSGRGRKGLEDDVFIQYPIRLEQALMEGSYDRVWGETKSERVPSEEFGLFSEVLIGTIRKEIASCSEKAYPSIPVSDAKSLLFLDSEGSVVKFAQELGWVVKDSRIYFPQQAEEMLGLERDILVTSDQVIENTLGYARELETIV